MTLCRVIEKFIYILFIGEIKNIVKYVLRNIYLFGLFGGYEYRDIIIIIYV